MSTSARKHLVIWTAAVLCLLVAYAAHRSVGRTSRPHTVSSELFTAGAAPRPAAQSTARAHDAGARRTTECRPDGIQVNSIGITGISVVTIGQDRDGVLDPPHGRVGWDKESALPGKPGVSLLAGHDEYYSPDVFWRLNQLRVGASVRVHCTSGTVQQWRVTTRKSLQKTTLADYLSPMWRSKRPLLALITCDPKSPVLDVHHTKNYVVLAEPVGSS